GDSRKRPSQRLSEFASGREPFFRILREGTAERGTQRGGVAALEWCERGPRIGAEGGYTAGPEQFVKQRRQAEHVGAPIPERVRHPLRGRIRTPDRSRYADLLERARDADTGQPRVVARQQHVAGMQ